MKGEPIFAWASLWRVSDEWGPVYSGAMTDANDAVAPVCDRMPVLPLRVELKILSEDLAEGRTLRTPDERRLMEFKQFPAGAQADGRSKTTARRSKAFDSVRT
jgi:putative SOS response-associated peptidase YedK